MKKKVAVCMLIVAAVYAGISIADAAGEAEAQKTTEEAEREAEEAVKDITIEVQEPRKSGRVIIDGGNNQRTVVDGEIEIRNDGKNGEEVDIVIYVK